MKTWGSYTDVLWHPIYGYCIYVGSATGPGGQYGRLCTYSQKPTADAIKHHEKIWEHGWEPSFHQLSDSSVLPERHRVFTIFGEAFGIVATDAYDKESPESKWNAFGTSDFVKQFQVDNGIPIRTDILHLNRCLPIKQPMRIDSRFEEMVCINCLEHDPPFYASVSGELFSLNNRLCRTCFDFQKEYGMPRPVAYVERYSLWKTAPGENCQICEDPFDRLKTKWDGPRRCMLPELSLWVCQPCNNAWNNDSTMLPIKGLHIPDNFRWKCDKCDISQSSWFQFIHLGRYAGKMFCFTCCQQYQLSPPILPKNFKQLYQHRSTTEAGYPTYDVFSAVPQGQHRTNFKRGLVQFVNVKFQIDLLSHEAVLLQRQKDLTLLGCDVPAILLQSIETGRPVRVKTDAAHLNTSKKTGAPKQDNTTAVTQKKPRLDGGQPSIKGFLVG
ncbi:hypothetical protein LTR70_000301 [Exophiala xenobiotica]|uniref:Uncharacterized protein n=1 Tax=Lithohypha guttulata TaxID=1690604 RepID=A0ABR0KPI0_9EURO|nr:hypothetical protein LTR24_000004 [Lithohypha guttulata]KAK5330471.1 hypothetical protein LTR70_000301 [Exophiala xenobiotica]